MIFYIFKNITKYKRFLLQNIKSNFAINIENLAQI